LDVVQRHDHRPVAGQHPQGVDHRKPDRVCVGMLLARLCQQERDRERPRRSERPGGTGIDRAEELRKRRKRQQCLRLGTPAEKDTK